MFIKFHGKRTLALLTAMLMVCAMTVTLAPAAKAEMYSLTSSKSVFDVIASGGDVTFTLLATATQTSSVVVNLSVSSSAGSATLSTTHVSLDVSGGSATSGNISVTISNNTTQTARTHTVTYTMQGDSSFSGTIVINQAAASPTPSISVSKNSLTIGAAVNSTVSFTVTGANFPSGTNITVAPSAGLTVTTASTITTPNSANTVTVRVNSANTSYSSTKSYTVTLSASGATSVTVYITQSTASTLDRPVVTSGQLVGQGGTLKISSYTISSGYEFVAVPHTGTKTYYKCTSNTGSAVTAVTMPVSIPEGTYNLCVRVVDSTTASDISDVSANTFVVNNSSPTISSTSPVANATGVSPLTPFSITFNKGMKTSVGTVVIRNTGSGGDPTITKTTWSNDDKTVTYTLSGVMANTTYTVTIYNTDSTGVTAFADTAGNLLNTQTVITFTTGAAATYASGVSTVPVYAVGTVSNNALTANIDDTAMDAAVTQAIKDEVSGYSSRIMLTLNNLPSTAVSADVTVSTSALYPVINRTGASLAISAGHLGTLTFNRNALLAIYGTGTGTVTFSVEKLGSTAMTSAVSNAVGTNPAYEFGVTVGSRTVTSFGTGQVTVSIPYTLAYSANPSQLVGYRVSANGTLTPVMGSYQPSSYSFDFRLKSFSTYVIKYNAKSYTDVYTTDWFSTAVDYTAARGLMDVFTTATTLEPERKITRAEFVVVFMKAFGIEASSAYTATQFEDVNPYSPHAEYIRTAKALGLIRGTNAAGTTFNPDGQVTRDQFFTLAYNALISQGLMPATDTGKRITNFSDAGSVSSYATTATDALVRAGVIAGSNGRLDPAAIFTRSQMAQAMYNLISQ